MNMELRDIEYFSVIAKHAHIGRAAEALDMGQPALSKSLRRLEQAVGTKLVKRIPKGVEITAAGVALLSRVRQLRLALDDVAREVSDIGQGRVGHIRIGVGTGFLRHPVSAACKALYQDAPNVALTVLPEATDVILTALRSGELDLVVGPMNASPSADIIEEHLFDDDFVVISSMDHRLAGEKRVTIADLAQEKWALMSTSADSPSTRRLRRVYEENNLPLPRIAVVTPSLALRDDLISSTDLLGYSATRVAREGSPRIKLAEFRIKELAHIRRVGVAYRKDVYLSPAACRFIDILKTVAKQVAS